MNCKEFDDKISLYIDGKLNNDEKKAFLDHSQDCQRCQRAMENTKRVVGSIQDLSHLKVPKDLSKGIIHALEMEMMHSISEDPGESLRKDVEENLGGTVQKDEQQNLGKFGQGERDGKEGKGRFVKQAPWIKKASLAAALVLVLTSAAILASDWLPSSIQDDMMVMEGGEESALEERSADESGDMDDTTGSIENGETPESEEGPGITAMEEEETEIPEESGSEEEMEEEAPGTEETPAPEDGEFTSLEWEDEDTLGINYGIWIALLLGIGVISVVVVFVKNRRN